MGLYVGAVLVVRPAWCRRVPRRPADPAVRPDDLDWRVPGRTRRRLVRDRQAGHCGRRQERLDQRWIARPGAWRGVRSVNHAFPGEPRILLRPWRGDHL